MITILKYPEIVVFANNAAIVEFEVEISEIFEYETFKRNAVIEIFNESDELLGTDILQFVPVLKSTELYNAILQFDISVYLQDKQKASFSENYFTELGIIQANLTNKTYCKIHHTLYDSETGNFEEFDSVTTDIITAVQGGFSKLFQISYADTVLNFFNRFLTWQPEKKILTTENDLLFFLYKETSQNCKIKFNLYFNDDSTQTVYSEVFTLTQYEAYKINSSFLQNNFSTYETLTKKVISYDCSIVTSAGVELISKRTYSINRDYYFNINQLFYKNSLGAFDLIYFKGVSEIENEFETQKGSFNDIAKTFLSKYSENKIVNSGWFSFSFLLPKKAKTYIIELVKSLEIYELLSNRIIPIIIFTNKFTINESDKFLYSIELEYKYASDEVYYSTL